MNVLMLPDYSQSNPYQKELAAALEKNGARVVFGNFNKLPVLRAVWAFWKPDVLHLHWTDVYFVAESWPKTILKSVRFLIEIMIVKLLRVKIIWTLHNISNHEKVKPGYERFINWILLHFYDQIIVHCSTAKDILIRVFDLPSEFKNKIHVVPHGHYAGYYKNQITQLEARAKLSIGNDELVFLYFGSIRPYKGIFDLVDAFRALEDSRLRLLIVGNPVNSEIKTEILRFCQIDNRIMTFLQYIPDDEIQIFMNAADVAVLPFTDILTSGSVLLAMSFGKAIIVPGIGCVSETLDDRGGILYDLKIADGLLNSMRKALSCNLSDMGHYNFLEVKKFDWMDIAKLTLQVYAA